MKEPHTLADLINKQPKDLTYEEVYHQLKLNRKSTNSVDDSSFNLFLDITSLSFDPDNQSYPFSEKLEENAHIELIDQMRSLVDHPDITWLLNDLFWTQQRKPENARLASEYACKSANSLEPNRSSLEIFKRIKRAVILSNQSNNDEAREKVKNEIRLVTEKHLKDPKSFLSVWLIDLLIEIKSNSILSELIKSELVLNAAVQSENSKNWGVAQRLRQAIVDILRILKFEDLAQKALIDLAHSYGQQAAAISNGLLSSHVYQKAIKSLQLINFPAMCVERDLLIEKFQPSLQIAQTARLKELKRIQSGPVDLSESVLALEKILDEAGSFEECFLILAARYPLQNKTSLESSSCNHLKQFPHSLFGLSEIVDEKGRTSSHPCLFKEKVSHFVTQQLSIDWAWKASLINHAREWIIRRYSVLESDWMNIISHNSYIPSGHHKIVAKALHQGLNAELLNSTHLLLPQFEASFRHILESNNIINQTITNNLKQKDKSINKLLSYSEMKNFINEDFCFEASRLLTEDGLNLRNNGLHGKIIFQAFYSYPSLYLWYLSIKFFCFGPDLLKPSVQDESTLDSESN